jgi:hypothetical protein
MGGCDLSRLTGDIIRNSGDWDTQGSEPEVQKNPAFEWTIMPRVEGRLIKRA